MKKSKRIPDISVLKFGESKFDRYVIGDQRSRLWNGEKFSLDRGRLYANYLEAKTDSHNILRSYFKDVTPVRYVVPCYLEVYSREPVSMQEVMDHMDQMSDLCCNKNGPHNSLILPRIEWNEGKKS